MPARTGILRRRQAPLNPYVALADVMINLLLIMTVYLLVSSSIKDAQYASHEAAVNAKLKNVYWKKVCEAVPRKGPNLEFRLKTSKLFPPNRADLTKGGLDILASLARFLNNPSVSDHFRRVFVTANQAASESGGVNPALAYRRAVVVRRVLIRSGVRMPIVPAGRTLGHDDTGEADRIILVLELEGPEEALARP